jgi:imidazolonepropionase-like amidohydrolase
MATVIEGGRLFTAVDETIIEKGIVVIGDDGRIVAAGEAGTIKAPAGSHRIDASGGTILPGLIDMHAHVLAGTDAESREGLTVNTITDQTIRALDNARWCVLAGITTVRDAGARSNGIFRIKKAIDEGSAVGPRIFASGQAIAMTGGHGWNGVAVEADGADEVRKVSRQQLKSGAECVKLMATGGAGTAGERVDDLQLTVDEMRAACEEAHKKGKHVFAHVTNSQGTIEAIEAGVDSIEHGLIQNDEAIDAMVSSGAYLCPTLEAYERIVRLGPSAGYYDYMVPKALSVLEPHRESFKRALNAGVKIIAGTDAGGHFWPLGDLADEIARQVEFGMSEQASIISATRTAAECLGLADQVGSLALGSWGDVLVVGGNPFEDIGALKNPIAVIKGGTQLL